MLESRSAYGYYGAAGGATGENEPAGYNDIHQRMPYYKFKRDYPKCGHYDYDPKTKTIVVIIPEERQTGSNFGNRYEMRDFYFWISDDKHSWIAEQRAKTLENAEKYIRRWCKRDGYRYKIPDQKELLCYGMTGDPF